MTFQNSGEPSPAMSGLSGLSGIAGGFDPLAILGSDLKIWHEAAKETAYADGETATTAADFSGNGDNSSQVGGVTYETNEINALPTFRFDGTDDYFGFAAGALDLSNNVGCITVFTIARFDTPTSAAANRWLGVSINSGATTYRLSLILVENTGVYRIGSRRADADANANKSAAVGPSAATWYIIIAERDYSLQTAKLWENGTSTINASGVGTAGNTDATNSNAIRWSSAVGNSPVDGDMPVLLIASSAAALGVTKLNQIQDGLAAKYGLTVVPIT